MLMQKMPVREQIVKTVVKSGNGGAVWVPKDWLGEEVIVILPEKPRVSLIEKVVRLLEPYLKDIISIGIYGSYARNEQTKDSDLDVIVITKDKNIKLNLKEKELDVVSFTIDALKKAVEKYPVMYYNIIQEAKPIINADVLEEFKNINPSSENFKSYLKETKEHLKSNKELLELDKLDSDYIVSHSILYSAILRLKGLFIMECILKKNKFSNEKFKSWLIKQGISPSEFEDCVKVYRAVRDNQNTGKIKTKIGIKTAERVINILKNEIKLSEDLINGKQKKDNINKR